MNISYEFSKIREAFKKIKEEMDKLSLKITENQHNFTLEHLKLQNEIKELSYNLKDKINQYKNHSSTVEPQSQYEISRIKSELSDLKEQISKTMHSHNEFNSFLDLIKKNQIDMKIIKDKLQSNELEIYLLKERLEQKEIELKKVKEINSHLIGAIDELSQMEIEILNKIA